MPATENETILRRWFEEVWNKGREEAIDEIFTEHTIAHGLGGDPKAHMTGTKDFKPFYREFRAAFPDIHVTVEDVICSGEKLAARCHVTGTHQGDAFGLKAEGRRVEFTGM